MAPACNDLAKNGGESDVDCGGSSSCARCVAGKTCTLASDCLSGVCAGGVCQAPTCSDLVKNGTETDVDCGGACATKCGTGKTCSVAADCASGVCSANVCQAPSCSDGVKNGTETDVDCGGSCGATCTAGKTCAVANDCVSGTCTGGICVTVTNLLQNPGFESGVASWDYWVDGASTSASTDSVYSGTYALKVGTGQGGRAQRVTSGISQNKCYRLTFWGRISGTGTGWQEVKLEFSQGGSTLNTCYVNLSGSSWTKYTINCNVPAALSPTAAVSAWKATDGRTLYVDDFVLVEGCT
jgi:hypothetical protein